MSREFENEILLSRHPIGMSDREDGDGDEDGDNHIAEPPHISRVSGKDLSSDFRSLMNLIKSNVGSGLLGLPLGYYYGGILGSAIGMLVVGIMAFICELDLVKCKHKINRKQSYAEKPIETYADMMEFTNGKWGRRIVDLTVAGSQMGFCCVYIIFVGDNLHALVPSLSQAVWCSIAVLCVILPISLAPALKHIASFTFVANICLVIGVSVVCVYAVPKFSFHRMFYELPWFHLETFPLFLAMAVYSFEGIGIVLPIETEMKHPLHFPRILSGVLIGMIFMFNLFALTCYVAYGDDVKGPINLNLPQHDPVNYIVVVLLLFAITLTYPLQIYPAFDILGDYVFGKIQAEESDPEEEKTDFLPKPRSVFKQTALRISIVVTTLILAISIPDFGLFIALVGGLTCTPLAFIYPSIISHSILPRTLFNRIKVYVIGTCGVLLTVVCTAVSIYDIVK